MRQRNCKSYMSEQVIRIQRESLIILNYQREIPPFIINMIKIALDRFDKVYYVTPRLYRDNSSFIKQGNVILVQGNWRDKLLSLIELPLSFFEVRILREIRLAINWHRISKAFFNSLLQTVVASNYLMRKTKEIIENNINDNFYILSAYFGADAYAAARIKEKYSGVRSMALAHSFEVNPVRDKNVDLHMNAFLHMYLDNINFISKSVYEAYCDYVLKKYNLSTENITFIHLGCEKILDKMSPPSEDGTFRIVSCSTVNPNKQLNRLLKVIASWKNTPLIWTHIGEGPDFMGLSSEAEFVMKNNPNVFIRLLGYKSNDYVHSYYAENSVDLFINISQIEGLPVSLMECMAYGIPAVATDVGGNKEIVNTETGYLIPQEFTDELLLNVLEKYSEISPDVKLVYRENSFNQWKTNFNGRKNINDIFSVLLNKR